MHWEPDFTWVLINSGLSWSNKEQRPDLCQVSLAKEKK